MITKMEYGWTMNIISKAQVKMNSVKSGIIELLKKNMLPSNLLLNLAFSDILWKLLQYWPLGSW